MFSLKNFEDLTNTYFAALKEQYGDEIATGENSNAFKLMAPVLDLVANFYEMMKQWQDNRDVTKATGLYLDMLLSNFNFSRKQPSQSKVVWTSIDSTPGTIIEPGDLQIETTDKIAFFNSEGAIVANDGSISVEMKSFSTGLGTNIAAGSLTEIITPINGIGTGSNGLEAKGGQGLETDDFFRKRFLSGKIGKGYWSTDGIYRAVGELNGVESVTVVENDTNATVNSLPPHSIMVVVDGGDDSEIANAIFEKSDQAIERYGNTTVSVTDIEGKSRTIKFERPINTTVYYSIEVLPAGSPVTDIVTSTKEYIDNNGIASLITSSKITNYLNQQGKLEGIESIVIKLTKQALTTPDLFSLQMEVNEKPVGELYV